MTKEYWIKLKFTKSGLESLVEVIFEQFGVKLLVEEEDMDKLVICRGCGFPMRLRFNERKLGE